MVEGRSSDHERHEGGPWGFASLDLDTVGCGT